MSKRKSVLDFVSRSPTSKSESGEANESNVVDAKLSPNPTSSKLSSDGSMSCSRTKMSSVGLVVKSPSNGALAKSKTPSVTAAKRSRSSESQKYQSQRNILPQKRQRINISGTDKSEEDMNEARKRILLSLQRFVNPKFTNARQPEEDSAKIPLTVTIFNDGDEIKESNEDSAKFPHEKLDFLRNIENRTMKGKPAYGPPHFPPRLYVPSKYLKNISPLIRQWWKIKEKQPDGVLLFKIGKFYQLFHMDAVIGVKELNLVFMKGDIARSKFPEIAVGKHSDCLIMKGYKVVRVEQMETVQMVNERIKGTSRLTSHARLIEREIRQITTRGTRTFAIEKEKVPFNNNYLLAICERNSEFGVVFIDASIGKFTFSQFQDDGNKSKLLTLMALYPPVEILYDHGSISDGTRHMLNNHLNGIDKVFSRNADWCARTGLIRAQKTGAFDKPDGSFEYPEFLMKKLIPVDGDLERPIKTYELAFNSFEAILSYLNECCIDDCLLSMKLFEVYVPFEVPSRCEKEKKKLSESFNNFNQHMILDRVTLQNLEIVPLLSPENPDGTLFGIMDYCSTNFGKRLFRSWLCSPLCNSYTISNRLDAIDDLLQIPEVVDAAVAVLKQIPDLERSLYKIHTYGLKFYESHPENRTIFYEEEARMKKKANEFLSTLEGFKQISDVISMFKPHLKDFKSILLRQCLSSDEKIGHFPDMTNELKYFEAFDHDLTKNTGNIIPTAGVNEEYELTTAEIEELTTKLDTFVSEQKLALNCKASSAGKYQLLLEVPENMNVPSGFEYVNSRKGSKRYYHKESKILLDRLESAEKRQESALKEITRNVFAHFDEKYNMWKSALDCISILDALISLVLYRKSSEVPMCRPKLFFSEDDVEPHIEIINGRHPSSLKYFTGDNYIPNSVYIGPKRNTNNAEVNSGGRLVLVTGPKMSGKSTLMKQAGTLVIMAHLGSYVPAESMSLTLVDRIFARVGASEGISTGERPSSVEARETSSILQHATSNSFVLVDELGRGTTCDGTAIAHAALDYLANDIGCRTLFSTQYHSLMEDFCDHPSVGLGHMACIIEKERDCPAKEKITFPYKFRDGACPKNYGFNVALLAGIPKNIVRQGFLKAQQKEYSSRLSKVLRRLLSVMTPEDMIQEVIKKYKFFEDSE